jgi:protease I
MAQPATQRGNGRRVASTERKETPTANELQCKKVAILIAPQGTEQVEFEEPKKAVEDVGATVEVVISDQTGEVQAVNNDLEPGDTFTVEKAFSEVSPEDYDAVVVPGGAVGADQLRGSEETVVFVRSFFKQVKPAGVICHAPWKLAW